VKCTRIRRTANQRQIQLALPFLRVSREAYLSRAFEFSRQFLFKWTVNWRFVGEETFLSKEFSTVLLAAHAFLLLVFGLTRWTKAADIPISNLARFVLSSFPADLQRRIDGRLTPDFITTTILTSMAIGVLCARSLHYQFYAYIAWSTPFLLWKAGLHPVAVYIVWALQEWAWNVYPSTNTSSMVVVGLLGLQVAGVWLGTSTGFLVESRSNPEKEHAHAD
jgi:alpha-1,3-mannosyltransferase